VLGVSTFCRHQVAHVDVLGAANSEHGGVSYTMLVNVIKSATRATNKVVCVLGVFPHTLWEVMGSLNDQYLSMGIMTGERYYGVGNSGTSSNLWET
jgi:hypothetical protein